MAEVRRSFLRLAPRGRGRRGRPGIARVVAELPGSLAEVLKRLKRRLDWALNELKRLNRVQERVGTLNAEDEAHSRRCKRVIARLKGEAQRRRSSAQGGSEDSETMGALAREGFLPGYGLESGSVVALAEPPRMTQGLDDFELPRAPTTLAARVCPRERHLRQRLSLRAPALPARPRRDPAVPCRRRAAGGAGGRRRGGGRGAGDAGDPRDPHL
ncbi:MAG: hypothetical protein IPI35_20570 [Deltaproteobacteria bacterium]|nr:hypothetical protein [Deltaproteobacteria bacterium]